MSMSSEWIRGKISREFSLGDYKFTEAVYSPDVRLSPHSHDFIYFRYVLAGTFTEYVSKGEFLSKPSTMMFRSSDETHSNHFHTKTRCLTIKLKSRQFEKISNNQKMLKDTTILSSKNMTRLFTGLYRELYSVDEFSEMTVEGLMLEIVAETFRQSVKRTFGNLPRWLVQTKENLDEGFRQNVTIETLANIAGVHPTHLVGEFRRHFKTTIGDYVRQRRIEFARKKLIHSNIPISEIALASGFFDQSHFTRVFKKVTGMTPAVYRTTSQSH